MAGFLKGLLVGLASFGLGMVVLSVVLPPDLRVSLDAPQVPPQEAEETTPEPEVVVAEASAPEAPALPEGTTEPASEPEVEVAEALAPETPALPEATTEVVPEAEVEVAEAPAPEAPALPEAPTEAVPEAEVEVAEAPASETPALSEATTEPAPEPEVEVVEAPAHETPTLPEALTEPASEPEVEVAEAPASETPTLPEAPTEPSPEPEVEVAEAPAPETPALPESPTEPTLEAEVEVAEAPASETPTLPDATTEPVTEPEGAAVATPEPRVLRAVPSVGLERAVEGVVTGRLPSIGADPQTPAPAPGDSARPAPEDAENLPALRRHAAAFDASADLPRLAVILIDAPGTEEALIALPFALTIAIDPGEPGAGERTRRYRAAGHEIAILGAGLPARATASDLTVTFSEWLRVLPQAVALLDPPAGGGITGDRLLAQAVMPFLAEQGHGLVTPVLGLNSAAQVAQSEGVPQASIYRLLDAADESEPVIRRYLSRAAFEAQSQGQAVALGRADHAPTLAALVGWRLEMRARQVALAPVSAVLDPQTQIGELD